jgi:hypothetical protein
MRYLLAMLVVLSSSAWAVDQYITRYRMGTVVISVGDPESKVLNARQPTRRGDVLNAFGAKIGEQWEFDEGRKVTAVVIQGGRVTKMFEVRQ